MSPSNDERAGSKDQRKMLLKTEAGMGLGTAWASLRSGSICRYAC